MAPKLEYANLMKELHVKEPPAGLYKEPCFWMEGKDMEGFSGHFSYGFIKQTGPIHPKEGALIHPYDECLIFAGIDHNDLRYMGAEVSVEIGQEREEYVFDKPTVIVLPKGTPHGPVTVRSLKGPFVHFTIGLSSEYRAEKIAPASLPPKSAGSKYAHLVKPLVTYQNEKGGSGTGMQLLIDSEGVMHPTHDRRFDKEQVGRMGPGNADHLVWLFGPNLLGMELNFTWGFYTQPGKWHRGGEGHTHPQEEALIFVGIDPDNIDYLGCEQELGMGPNYERHIFNKPTVAVCPKALVHLPLITRWVDKPYAFIVLCLTAEHDSPWVDA